MAFFPFPLGRLLPLVVVVGTAAGASGQGPVVWSNDYNSARKKAAELGTPILLQIGSENCFYCKKMDATTFADPTVQGLMSSYQTIKIDGNKETGLTRVLKVTVYPTTILAGPDGGILKTLPGYVASDAFIDHLKTTKELVAVDCQLIRDVAEASRAVQSGNYSQALPDLRRLAQASRGKPAETQVKGLLSTIDGVGEARITAADALMTRGDATAAKTAFESIAKEFAGCVAAGQAETRLVQLGVAIPLSGPRAATVLAAANDLAAAGWYRDAMELTQALAGTSEAEAATRLSQAITSDPERLAAATVQANRRAAEMQVALAESWLKHGNTTEAEACLTRAGRLDPNCPALVQHLAQQPNRGKELSATPTSRSK